MLSARQVLMADGVGIAGVTCRHEQGRGEVVEPVPSQALVFVRRGCDGERDLARLAADLGFADQSHFYRVVRAEAGTGSLGASSSPEADRERRMTWS